MEFYILRALFPALIIDIYLTIRWLDRDKKALAAFATILLYPINTFAWVVFLGQTNPAFSGQGALGLAFLMGVGIVITILRLIFGMVVFFQIKRR